MKQNQRVCFSLKRKSNQNIFKARDKQCHFTFNFCYVFFKFFYLNNIKFLKKFSSKCDLAPCTGLYFAVSLWWPWCTKIEMVMISFIFYLLLFACRFKEFFCSEHLKWFWLRLLLFYMKKNINKAELCLFEITNASFKNNRHHTYINQ